MIDLNELKSQMKNCPCGREHKCDVDRIVIKSGALAELDGLTADYDNILLVADRNTYAACGGAAERCIGGKIKAKAVFECEGFLIPDEEAVAYIEEKLPCGCDLIVGVGSGVINDLCKFVSFRHGLPYFIVATAPSMDGYVSTGAAMVWEGMKETFTTHVPTAVIADTAVLKDAPMELIQSGYGDIIGKYSALNDWRLAALVHGEYFCQSVYDLMEQAMEKTVPLADKLLQRDEESVGVLMEALILAGVAMAFAGNSRPASGSEHHLSHFFEITGIVHGREYFSHGVDVIYSTLVTANLRERLTAIQAPTPVAVDMVAREKEIRRIYGSVAEGVLALQEKMGRYSAPPMDVYANKWKEVKEILSEMPSSERIRELINGIGLKVDEFVKMYGEDVISDAVVWAKDLKDRYTVLWLYNEVE